MAVSERAAYVDEADVFYNDVPAWLYANMESAASTRFASTDGQVNKTIAHTDRTVNGQVTGTNRPWPQYLVFFEQLLPQMFERLPPGVYKLCARLRNTDWHDDWRRQGSVYVFCLQDTNVGV